jgi:hypothetical protein
MDVYRFRRCSDSRLNVVNDHLLIRNGLAVLGHARKMHFDDFPDGL